MAAHGDHAEYRAFLRRIMRAYGKRLSDADPEDLAEMLSLRAALDEALQTSVDGMRANGFTWSQIGTAAGISKQAAQARWGRKPST